MSEELAQKGYLREGRASGDATGTGLESFNLGATTLRQLAAAGIVPARDFNGRSRLRPDGLLVDRRGEEPRVRLVVELKRPGALRGCLKETLGKVASEYCGALECDLAVVSDGELTRWVALDPKDGAPRVICREDDYEIDAPADLASPEGRRELGRTVARIGAELNFESGCLEPPAPVDPTALADRTWQAIWLASGEQPERCLASFVEVLLFKFLSDLGSLGRDRWGRRVDFDHVAGLSSACLDYYLEAVRPEILRLFPAGEDGTAVVGGLALARENEDHNRLFAEILANFRRAERLRRIDPEFKSRIFERFLKKSISKKNWGQFFTPRNVVKAVVEMSGIERLPPGAQVVDPFCGVGGFLLEPLLHKRPHDFRLDPKRDLRYAGYDRDPATIALAKANMLIHLSEILEREPDAAPSWLSKVLNNTFVALSESVSGSLALRPSEEWDLVMTNPPYVVAGTTDQRRRLNANPELAAYYSVPGSGVESLGLQAVIKGLRPGGRALVIVPDGLLLRHADEELRRHLLRECVLEAIVSLPDSTFYSTAKKTYLLVFTKKQDPGDAQTEPVLTYLVSEMGETRDAKRFPTPARDHLPGAVAAFRHFRADPGAHLDPRPERDLGDPRARVVPIESFRPEDHWLVDRWWPEEERRGLGEGAGERRGSLADVAVRAQEGAARLAEAGDAIVAVPDAGEGGPSRKVSLDDGTRFRLSIGTRVLERDLFGRTPGEIPLYSANVHRPFGWVHDSNLTSFERPSVIWGIDGDFDVAVIPAGTEFATTDHCGRIEILDERLDAGYCRAAIARARSHGFDRTLRPSLRRIRSLEFPVPVDGNGEFDLEAQRALAARYESAVEAVAEAKRALQALSAVRPEEIPLGIGPEAAPVATTVRS